MARNGPKMAIYESYIFSIFFTKLQKQEMKKIVFYVVAFDPNKILTVGPIKMTVRTSVL